MINVALDVSKGLSHYVIIQNDEIVDEGIVYHNKSSFKKFYDMLHYLDEIPNVIFEATGVYSKTLERFFTDFEINYKVVNLLAAHLKLQSLRQNKTDVSDARALASIANDPVFMTHSKVGDNYEQLKTLSNNYLQIIEDIKIISNRIRRGLELSFPEMNKLFNPITSTLALTFIRLFPHPDALMGMTRTKLKNLILKSTNKKISQNIALEKAEYLLKVSQLSYPAIDMNDAEISHTLFLVDTLEDYKQEKNNLKKQLIKLVKELPEFDCLVSIPGIGELTLALFIGQIGCIKRFDSAKKVNAFVGIDIRRYQSGQKAMREHIGRHVNTKARVLLYEMIQSMLFNKNRIKNHIVDYYYKLKTAPMNKPHMVAVVGAENHLIRCMYNLVKFNTIYD